MTLDLNAYFERINYRGAAEPNLAVLQDLVTAHTRDHSVREPRSAAGSAGRRSESRGLDRQAGSPAPGWLLLRAERADGLRAGRDRLSGATAGRASDLDAAAGRAVGAQTHTVLAVTFPGSRGPIVDVGFGGQTPARAIRLETGSVQRTTHEPYRLEDRGDGWSCKPRSAASGSRCRIHHPHPPDIDLKVGSWFVSTHPSSHFVDEPDGRAGHR